MSYQVRWWYDAANQWMGYELPCWRRISACKIAAKQAQRRDCVPIWDVIDLKTGKKIIEVTRMDGRTR